METDRLKVSDLFVSNLKYETIVSKTAVSSKKKKYTNKKMITIKTIKKEGELRSLLFSNVICHLIMLSSSPGNCLCLTVLFSFSSGGFVSCTSTISETTSSEA